MNQRTVSNYEYLPVLVDLLGQGHTVSLIISGSSMTPFLADKRDTLIISPPDGNFRRGDMVFYQRLSGQYVMHRIHHVGPDGALYIVGDAQTDIEGPVHPKQVFGVIRQVIRKGKTIDSRDFWWFFFEKIWIRMVPLRPALRKLYTLFARK